MRIAPIKNCRICGSVKFRELFDLGSLRSCGTFPRANDPDAPAAPLNVIQCADCGLVQLSNDFEPEELFRSTYGYRSGLNESMVKHLSRLIATAESRVALKRGDVALDIGSNDGTLLSAYTVEGLTRIGIDPTIENFRKYYPPGIITLAEFFSEENFRRVLPNGSARIITSISMFYDLPSPNDFVRNISSLIANDGIWILEQSYLPRMVETNSFDTICHEHVEYYTMRQIVDLTERHGLRVFDVILNDINGGSFQVWVCPKNAQYSTNSAAITQLLENEAKEGYSLGTPILELKSRVAQIRNSVLGFLNECRRKGKLVHGYGASTKGNTLLQFFNITPELIPAIAERNSEKFGCRTPGTGIPIISEAESRAMSPDYYFALPWHFRESFLARERDFLERGGQFVFPLPQFEVVSART